jgi:hypothetical protein
MKRDQWGSVWKWVVGVVAALIIALDIVAIVGGGVDATLSRHTVAAASEHPTLPLIVGFVLGHLFWPQRLPPKDNP